MTNKAQNSKYKTCVLKFNHLDLFCHSFVISRNEFGEMEFCTNKQKGFTLIEVMVTVAILSFGTLMIQQGLLRSASLLYHFDNQLIAEIRSHEKLWDAREKLLFSEEGQILEPSGTFSEGGKSLEWTLASSPKGGADELYLVKLDTAWQEGNKQVELNKAIFMTANKKTR
ncbi:MAG: hypothetical protein AUJ72_05080 [Candidatus Omnitrophica bacterium CG1_02_46_14]|nr:MAG: hypothetical protein AUJ72_05080 [Candidatus Omnitrophica bacterium CG1_02_46_14]